MEDIKQSLTKIRDTLVDLKAQDYEHFKKTETSQSAIESKMSVVSNKVIVLLLLVGIILGINICYYKDLVILNLQYITDIVKAIMRLGNE